METLILHFLKVLVKETLKEEVFALEATCNETSKNPPASCSEDIEVLAAVDMPPHLLNISPNRMVLQLNCLTLLLQ